MKKRPKRQQTRWAVLRKYAQHEVYLFKIWLTGIVPPLSQEQLKEAHDNWLALPEYLRQQETAKQNVGSDRRRGSITELVSRNTGFFATVSAIIAIAVGLVVLGLKGVALIFVGVAFLLMALSLWIVSYNNSPKLKVLRSQLDFKPAGVKGYRIIRNDYEQHLGGASRCTCNDSQLQRVANWIRSTKKCSGEPMGWPAAAQTIQTRHKRDMVTLVERRATLIATLIVHGSLACVITALVITLIKTLFP